MNENTPVELFRPVQPPPEPRGFKCVTEQVRDALAERIEKSPARDEIIRVLAPFKYRWISIDKLLERLQQ